MISIEMVSEGMKKKRQDTFVYEASSVLPRSFGVGYTKGVER